MIQHIKSIINLFKLSVLLALTCFSCSEKQSNKSEKIITSVKQDEENLEGTNHSPVFSDTASYGISGYWIATSFSKYVDEAEQDYNAEEAAKFKESRVLFFVKDSLYVGNHCPLRINFSISPSTKLFPPYELEDYKVRLKKKFGLEIGENTGVVRNFGGLKQECDFLKNNIYLIDNRLLVEDGGYLYLFEKTEMPIEKILEIGKIAKLPISSDKLEEQNVPVNTKVIYNKGLSVFSPCGEFEYFILPGNSAQKSVRNFIFKNYCGDDIWYSLVSILNSKIINNIPVSGAEHDGKSTIVKKFTVKDSEEIIISKISYNDNVPTDTTEKSYLLNDLPKITQ